MTKSDIKDWLTYWKVSKMLNLDRILAYDQVFTARLYCPFMNRGRFAAVTDGQIWDAIREMRRF